jgi:hypothetical protein
MALFAAALVSLAQMIASVDTATNTNTVDTAANTNTPSWEALRFFTYTAIVLNLSGAVVSLMVIKMCSDVPLAAQQKLLEVDESDLTDTNQTSSQNQHALPSIPPDTAVSIFDPEWITARNRNIPLAAAREGVLVPELLLDHFRLLESFGMSTKYRIVDQSASLILMAACACTSAAMGLWIFLTESIVTAGITMISFGSTGILVLTVFLIGSLGQGWR